MAGAEAVIMPRLDMTTEEMTILRWMKREGEFVEVGEPLLEVMTEKIAIEIEASASGYVRGLRFEPEAVVPVGEVIAYIAETAAGPLPGNDTRARDRDGAGATVPRGEGVAAETVAAEAGPVRSGVRAAPLVRRMAADLGMELEEVRGTGPGGRVLAEDVRREAMVRSGGAAGTGTEPGEVGVATTGAEKTGAAKRVSEPDEATRGGMTKERLTPMRLAIAGRMEASWQEAPHVTLTIDVDMSEAAAFRAGLQRALAAEGGPRGGVGSDFTARGGGSAANGPPSLTWNSFIAWVAVQALVRQPRLNATLEDDVLCRYDDVHLGVAVDADAGLLVPVVRDAQRMGPGQLAAAITQAVHQTKQGRLKPEDVTGGTFTLTNLGGFGVNAFTPIINPPQIAILGVGAVREHVIPVDGEPMVRPVATFALSIDHRALDGADGARYLATLKDLLLHPHRLVV